LVRPHLEEPTHLPERRGQREQLALAEHHHRKDRQVQLVAHLRGLIDHDDRRQAARIENLLERDYFLKRMAGFEETHFTQISDVLRPWPRQ
jgi:hypothetical protein